MNMIAGPGCAVMDILLNKHIHTIHTPIHRLVSPRCVPVASAGPNLYYYEVIECGRRILLTGVLIFIDPYSSAQAAAACIFAFVSLLGFELLRPHLDPADAWLYRLVRRIVSAR